jgi:hypothetical protein
MSIIHVRPKWIKQHQPKKKRSKSGMPIERNQEGVLYFRQPIHPDQVVTWHVYPTGEDVLRRSGVTEGGRVSGGLFTTLKKKGLIYTYAGRGKEEVARSAPAPAPVVAIVSPEEAARRATKAEKRKKQAEQDRARRDAAAKRVLEKHKWEQEQSRRGRPTPNRVITVSAKVDRSATRTSSPKPPIQRSFASAQTIGSRPRPSDRHPRSATARPTMVTGDSGRSPENRGHARIHSGWFSTQLPPESGTVQDGSARAATPIEKKGPSE